MVYVKIRKVPAKISDPNLRDYGTKVIEGISNSAFFPDAEEYLAPAKTAFNNYVIAIPSDSEKSKVNNAKKEKLKAVFLHELALLALYVEFRARFDFEALSSSNFKLTSTKRETKGIVGLVKNVNMKTNGEPGVLIVQCDTDPNTTLYKVRVSEDEENWLWFKASTRRKIKVPGLSVGKKFFVQMQLENLHGHSPWSPSVIGLIPEPEAVGSIHE